MQPVRHSTEKLPKKSCLNILLKLYLEMHVMEIIALFCYYICIQNILVVLLAMYLYIIVLFGAPIFLRHAVANIIYVHTSTGDQFVTMEEIQNAVSN